MNPLRILARFIFGEPTPPIAPSDLLSRIESGDSTTLLDVRTADEFAAGHLPGALNIPLGELRSRLGEIGHTHGQPLVVY